MVCMRATQMSGSRGTRSVRCRTASVLARCDQVGLGFLARRYGSFLLKGDLEGRACVLAINRHALLTTVPGIEVGTSAVSESRGSKWIVTCQQASQSSVSVYIFELSGPESKPPAEYVYSWINRIPTALIAPSYPFNHPLPVFLPLLLLQYRPSAPRLHTLPLRFESRSPSSSSRSESQSQPDSEHTRRLDQTVRRGPQLCSRSRRRISI